MVNVVAFDIGMKQINEGLALFTVLGHEKNHGIDNFLKKTIVKLVFLMIYLPTSLTITIMTELSIEISD